MTHRPIVSQARQKRKISSPIRFRIRDETVPAVPPWLGQPNTATWPHLVSPPSRTARGAAPLTQGLRSELLGGHTAPPFTRRLRSELRSGRARPGLQSSARTPWERLTHLLLSVTAFGVYAVVCHMVAKGDGAVNRRLSLEAFVVWAVILNCRDAESAEVFLCVLLCALRVLCIEMFVRTAASEQVTPVLALRRPLRRG